MLKLSNPSSIATFATGSLVQALLAFRANIWMVSMGLALSSAFLLLAALKTYNSAQVGRVVAWSGHKSRWVLLAVQLIAFASFMALGFASKDLLRVVLFLTIALVFLHEGIRNFLVLRGVS